MSAEQVGLPFVGCAELDAATELEALRNEVEGLRRALETRAPIEQAKGMLMMRYGIPQDSAFRLLTRWSSEHNVKVRVVASTLVGLFARDDAFVDQDMGPDELLRQIVTPRPDA